MSDEDGKQRPPLLIYHGGCPDGFGAAFSFWKKYGDTIEYLPLVHKNKPYHGLNLELFQDRKVWMVDISLNRDDAILVSTRYNNLEIIDHHLSSQKQLSDLNFCTFDLCHSGAFLAWKYCFGENNVPKLIQYIEDRDINNWKLPYAKQVLSILDSYERTFESWDKIHNELESPTGFSRMIESGDAICRYTEQIIKNLKKDVYFTKIKGHLIPVINTAFFRPEVVKDLSVGQLFAAGYHYNGECFVFSLRSDDNDKNALDVSEIAGKFPGGGGHKHAAGFSIKTMDELNG